jgi:enamine deaminase RidA (YjgF/YER057c/UK114 family)
MTAIEERISSLGINIPSDPPQPAGAYIPIVKSGNIAYVSGQIPIKDGKVVFTGKVTDDNLEDARESAKICILNVLANLKKEFGTLDRITRIVKISGFVNSSQEFTAHPKVINSASDLLYEIFGESGKHARIAVGVASLPLGSMTEIDAIVEFSD